MSHASMPFTASKIIKHEICTPQQAFHARNSLSQAIPLKRFPEPWTFVSAICVLSSTTSMSIRYRNWISYLSTTDRIRRDSAASWSNDNMTVFIVVERFLISDFRLSEGWSLSWTLGCEHLKKHHCQPKAAHCLQTFLLPQVRILVRCGL